MLAWIAVAHHVQKKATKGHNAFRPRKSRPSDINRKPPSYPTDGRFSGPWWSYDEAGASDGSMAKSTVSLTIAPTDTAADVRAKLQAAGSIGADDIVYKGIKLTGSMTLADAGLTEEVTQEATVAAPA